MSFYWCTTHFGHDDEAGCPSCRAEPPPQATEPADADVPCLRNALRRCGILVGAGLSPSVSTGFLMGVPGEVRLSQERLLETLLHAECWIRQIPGEGPARARAELDRHITEIRGALEREATMKERV